MIRCYHLSEYWTTLFDGTAGILAKSALESCTLWMASDARTRPTSPIVNRALHEGSNVSAPIHALAFAHAATAGSMAPASGINGEYDLHFLRLQLYRYLLGCFALRDRAASQRQSNCHGHIVKPIGRRCSEARRTVLESLACVCHVGKVKTVPLNAAEVSLLTPSSCGTRAIKCQLGERR